MSWKCPGKKERKFKEISDHGLNHLCPPYKLSTSWNIVWVWWHLKERSEEDQKKKLRHFLFGWLWKRLSDKLVGVFSLKEHCSSSSSSFYTFSLTFVPFKTSPSVLKTATGINEADSFSICLSSSFSFFAFPASSDFEQKLNLVC